MARSVVHAATPAFVIYGSYGYTGNLIAEYASRQLPGVVAILSGRDAKQLAAQSERLRLKHVVAAATEDELLGVVKHLQREYHVTCVLNCAGPFQRTFHAVAGACIKAKVHYIDVTGESPVFEAAAVLGGLAQNAGVMLMPGAGYDVVATDMVAAHLAKRLPSATHLILAMKMSQMRLSHGTATTVLESLASGQPMVVARVDGMSTFTPPPVRRLPVVRDAPPIRCMPIPWGDVVTAYRSTGIPNIAVYLPSSRIQEIGRTIAQFAPVRWLLGSRLVLPLLRRWLPRTGPSPKHNRTAAVHIYGEAADTRSGKKVVSRLRCWEAYHFTAIAALSVVERVVAGDAPPGYQTASTAYGTALLTGMVDRVYGLPPLQLEDASA